jgi:hypothetical protein
MWNKHYVSVYWIQGDYDMVRWHDIVEGSEILGLLK